MLFRRLSIPTLILILLASLLQKTAVGAEAKRATSANQPTSASNMLPVDISADSPREKKSPPPADPAQSKKLLQIFHLKHTHANALAPLLQSIIPDATFTPEDQTNSLIISATEDQFDVIKSLIQDLDTAPIGREESGKTATPQSIETTRDDYNAKQREAASVVRSLANEEDEEAAGQLRARLKRLVSEAFDLRQKLQRAELGLLKERMQIVETRLRQRETLRKQIIERRVESLLAGEDDADTTGAAASPSVPPATASTRRQQTHSDTAARDMNRVNLGTSWVGDDVLLSLAKEDREATWVAAFKQQREKKPWPVQLSPEFQKCLQTIRDNADIPAPFLDEYWNFVKKQAPEIDRLIDRRRPNMVGKTPPGSKEGVGAMSGYGSEAHPPELIGIVEWNESDYARIQTDFYWVQRPSTIQVRLAQEDLWCYEAILRAIAKTNKDARATTYFDAAIDRIETLAIGQPAAQAMGASRPRRAHSAYFGTPPSKVVPPVEKEAELGFAPAAPLNTGLGGISVLKDVAERLLTGRYVDLTGTPLTANSKRYPEFNLLPVQLVVDLQESRLPDLLNNLAASAMPLDVICVDVSGTPKVKPVEEADPRIRAKILGMIRIFNPPDVKELDASVVKPGTVQDILVRMGFRDQPWKDVLQWLADSAGLQLNVIGKMPEGTFTHASSQPLTLEEARRIVAGKLIFEGYAVYLVQDGDRDCFLVQETAAGQAKRRATEAAEDVAKWTKALVEEDRQDDEAYLATVKRRLDEAEKRLAAERQNVAQMVGQSQLNLQKAQASLESARQELETTRKLQAKGYVKQAELDALEQEVQRRSDQAVMCQADAELYRSAAEVLGLTPADIEKAKAELGKTSETMDEVLGIVVADPAKTTPPQISLSTADVGARASLPLRTPEDFVTAASGAKFQFVRAQQRLKELESRPADQDDGPSDITARLDEQKQYVAETQRRLEIIQAEYAAQLRLRSLELQSAQADASAAQSELEREEALFKMGRLPVDEVQKTRLRHEQAKLRVQAAETLLELYNKAGESPDLKPSPKAGSKKTEDKGGDSETVSKSKQNTSATAPPSSAEETVP